MCIRDRLSKVKNANGVIQVPGIYDDVEAPAPAEKLSWKRLPFSEEEFRLKEVGSSELTGERKPSVLERVWARPTFEVQDVYKRQAWSLLHIHGLKRRATMLGQRGNIRLLASAEARVPMAAGFVRRAIVFPHSVLDSLTPEEFEQVLCHEMAHLGRWDDWTQLAHAIAQAILFFNPAIYWIGRRLKIEREMACDDWVVSTTGEARPYAACLTHLHEVTRRARAPQLAPGATSGKQWQIVARVEALLQPDRNSTPRFSRSGWMAACALVSAALIVAGRTTPPVGVQEIPLATMALAHLRAPAAPAISCLLYTSRCV